MNTNKGSGMETDTHASIPHAHKPKPELTNSPWFLGIVGIITLLVLFNMWQITQLSSMLGTTSVFSAVTHKATLIGVGNGDLNNVDLSTIQNTAQAIATVLPVKDIKDAQDAINKLIPTGTPEYGTAMGVSYDKPVDALAALARGYPALKQDIKTNNPEIWQRYLNLATKPVGISCEYCCGVGPTGITSEGELTCGCSHSPALQAVTLWLMKNTQMTDAEILREVLRWKTLWFPKDMVGLALQISGGDTSVLQNVPGMVGGC